MAALVLFGGGGDLAMRMLLLSLYFLERDGLLPDELPVCIARTACDKYKQVAPMGPGAKVKGFLTNLLTEYDEEDVVLEAAGMAPVEGKHVKKAGR